MCSRLSALVVLFALTACMTSVVLAEDHPQEHTGAVSSDHADKNTTHGDDTHGGEKPALLHWDFGSAFWSIAVFVLLLVILRFAAWKPILSALQQREKFITDSLAEAKRDREAAQRVLAEYTAKVDHARQEASAIVEEGRRDADEVRKRIAAEARSEAEATLARAKKDIEMARDAAVKDLHEQAVTLATMMTSKLVRRELSPADHKRLLDESLSDLSRASN
jgi:F-type H+-transporting ATPase subunit b